MSKNSFDKAKAVIDTWPNWKREYQLTKYSSDGSCSSLNSAKGNSTNRKGADSIKTNSKDVSK